MANKDQQAELEQAAREWLEYHVGNVQPGQEKVLAALLAAQRVKVLGEALNRGEVWSFMRRVLSQGGDIQIDYQAGKYKGYEEYSARLDAAARERADQFIKEAQEQRP